MFDKDDYRPLFPSNYGEANWLAEIAGCCILLFLIMPLSLCSLALIVWLILFNLGIVEF